MKKNTPLNKLAMALCLTGALAACQPEQAKKEEIKPAGPTAADARAYVEKAEKQLEKDYEYQGQTAWVQANFVTEDTNALMARVSEQATKLGVSLALGAKKFNDLELDYDTRRKLEILKAGLTLPAPEDDALNAELAKITSNLDAIYAKGCTDKNECFNLGQLSGILADPSKSNQEKLDAWVNWRQVSPQMRKDYKRMVEIANQGSKELGFADTGALWRSKYDMPADDFAKEMDRVWGQVKPLYNSLQCHVRAKLNEKYGDDVVSKTGPIPAHLLGNMWAQSWGNIFEDVAPQTEAKATNLTERLTAKQYSEVEMVRTAEDFFVSLGFERLPDTFWDRSLFVEPKDRTVQCHASAWDLSTTDYRIKMCIKKNAEDFIVIHHELGHNFYQRAYNLKQPMLYRSSANDGFHEAIGDTVALSINDSYLKEIGLIDQIPDESADLPFLMKMALDKIAFVPFGLIVDKWRWGVFNGEIPADKYNEGWWKLREEYQGVKAPVARTEESFDPGAKYHVPGSVPYSRYFLAHILQFQFHRELCKIAGSEGPLHRCSIYGSKEAGAKLNAMLELGMSKTWQEALKTMTGSGDMDASAILDYFAPLQKWLDTQNAGRQCGW
ncbi:M2 family metallopeptidase [Aliikangiella coralliicola]|uniref:M2 family metallopeptidase n=1 Tax=Aliikangiella coralliicola TaxID=2592383 RepID=A0A545U4N2_9GAMM|nr:M2 family metallopeptidase [Aliikangiella coralliicola]TQV84435.1 M2 family metallopeptidase [Aliikangiella coralliicola]